MLDDRLVDYRLKKLTDDTETSDGSTLRGRRTVIHMTHSTDLGRISSSSSG